MSLLRKVDFEVKLAILIFSKGRISNKYNISASSFSSAVNGFRVFGVTSSMQIKKKDQLCPKAEGSTQKSLRPMR